MSGKSIGTGIYDFKKLIDSQCFYVDKTYFIKQWIDNNEEVSLITRPRRFGKTLTMSMMEYFLSDKYKDEAYLFENLSIWNSGEKYRKLQGSSPVINISFATIKKDSYGKMYDAIKELIIDVYNKFDYLLESEALNTLDKSRFQKILYGDANEIQYIESLRWLSEFLEKVTGKKVYIFLDEYDTPLQEAYVSGFWDEAVMFIRDMFSSTFKENRSLNRAILTGITSVSKESIFSGLNNLKVITTTSEKYADCFGFTEDEVYKALEEYDLLDEKDRVKNYYNGFIMGKSTQIYNPWSVICFLDEKEYKTYWANTSSNGLINKAIKTGNVSIKRRFAKLMKGQEVDAVVDEEIVFSDLDTNPEAIWSLLLASGYVKVCSYNGRDYKLAATNQEVIDMLEGFVRTWFNIEREDYDCFILAMLEGDERTMEYRLNELSGSMFSTFDVGNKPSKKNAPERFYHGFVLGLMVDLKKRYEVDSNRESGNGRYDIMLRPKDITDVGIIMEFKVFDAIHEEDIEGSVTEALNQIDEMKYEQKLIDAGVKQIYKYGVAFKGKTCRIGKR